MATFLSDRWVETGTDFSDFEAVINRLEKATVTVPLYNSKMKFCSVDERPDTLRVDGKIPLRIFHKDNVYGVPDISAVDVNTMADAGVPEDILAEILRTKLLIQYEKSVFFTAEYLSRDLGARAGLGGEAFGIPCEARSHYLASRFSTDNGISQATVRREGRVAKIVALGSKTFAHVPQTLLMDLLHEFEGELGKAECERWYVSHQYTMLTVSFPEKARDIAGTYGLKGKFEPPTPGMIFETSDTGDCSVRCSAVWFYGKGMSKTSLARAESYSRRHSLSALKGRTLAEIAFEEASKKVFKTYKELPERLCTLMSVDVVNPKYVLEKMFEHLNVRKLLGQGREQTLLEVMQGEIHPAELYTGYDIAVMFMQLSQVAFEDGLDGKSGMLKSKMEEITYKAPFCPIEKWASIKTPAAYIIPA